MKEAYLNSQLNATLARWISAEAGPKRDCMGCALPAKCCDFQPFVPNFLLGGWLAEKNQLPQIKNVYFTPIGGVPTPQYKARHVDGGGPDYLCGFYDQGACRLWFFRPGECSTYFCGEARSPARDQAFAVEMAVAQMALVELGFSNHEISEQVDLVNGAAAKEYPGDQMLIMYKKAWKWSLNLQPETVREWI